MTSKLDNKPIILSSYKGPVSCIIEDKILLVVGPLAAIDLDIPENIKVTLDEKEQQLWIVSTHKQNATHLTSFEEGKHKSKDHGHAVSAFLNTLSQENRQTKKEKGDRDHLDRYALFGNQDPVVLGSKSFVTFFSNHAKLDASSTLAANFPPHKGDDFYHKLVSTLRFRHQVIDALQGVTQGFIKDLELVGVGYRAFLSSGRDVKEFKVVDTLCLRVGTSNPLQLSLPAEVRVSCPRPTLISIFGFYKQDVHHLAARIRHLVKVDPYKGKGIIYDGEVIRKKEGKRH